MIHNDGCMRIIITRSTTRSVSPQTAAREPLLHSDIRVFVSDVNNKLA